MSDRDLQELERAVSRDPSDDVARLRLWHEWRRRGLHAEHAGIPADLTDSNWASAFSYAGEHATPRCGILSSFGKHCSRPAGHDAQIPHSAYEEGYVAAPNIERAVPTDAATALAPFGRRDVLRIYALSEGEKDERPWLCLGELRDGRFFFLRAGCDFTGWD